MIKILEKKPAPRATHKCNSCGSLLEYGNGDLYEERCESFYSLNGVMNYYLICPVCQCKQYASWVCKGKESDE